MFHDDRDLLAVLCPVPPEALAPEISFPFLVNYSRPPRGYHFLARRRIRSSPFLADEAGFDPAAFRSSKTERPCEPNVLRPDTRQYIQAELPAPKTPNQAFSLQNKIEFAISPHPTPKNALPSSRRHVPSDAGRIDGSRLNRRQRLGKRLQVSKSNHGNHLSRRGIHDVPDPRRHELLPNVE